MQKRADVVQASGDLARAEELMDRRLTLVRATYGDQDNMTLKALNQLGKLIIERGEPARAEPLLREAVERATRVNRQGPGLGFLSHTYGDCLLRLGRFADAEELLLDSLAAVKPVDGDPRPRDPAFADRVKSLIALYEAWGKPDRVEEYRAMIPGRTEQPPAPRPDP